MKRVFTLLSVSIIFLITSCKSIDKYVKKGDYTQAVDYGLHKLERGKTLNRKEIRAFEQGYRHIRENIEKKVYLKSVSKHSFWHDIYTEIEQINTIQHRIKEQMPIRDKNGYEAQFEFVNVGRQQEIALATMNQKDLTEIEYIVDSRSGEHLLEVFELYERIDRRQKNILSMPYIIGIEGYRPQFAMEKIGQKLNQARYNAAKETYDQASKQLNLGKEGDKIAARRAYDLYTLVEQIKPTYRNTSQKINEARDLGIVRVNISFRNSTYTLLPQNFLGHIYSCDLTEAHDDWTQFSFGNGSPKTDIQVIYDIQQIDVSPIAIHEEVDEVSKKIKDGWEYELDQNGNVKKDTSGNDIKRDRYIEVYADFVEVHQSKTARVIGSVWYENLRTKDRIMSEPFEVINRYEGKEYAYRGDDRALSPQMKCELDKSPDFPPSDIKMLMKCGTKLRSLLQKEMKRMLFYEEWYN